MQFKTTNLVLKLPIFDFQLPCLKVNLKPEAFWLIASATMHLSLTPDFLLSSRNASRGHQFNVQFKSLKLAYNTRH